MKKIVSIISISLLFSRLLHAQTIDRFVIGSGGGYFSASNASLSWTLGETVTQTFESPSSTLTQGFQQPYKLHINLKYFIEGYYVSAGFMQPVLNNQGRPNGYNDADSVTIELHNPTAPYAMAHTYTGVLKTNGTIFCSFPNATEGSNYYIVLKNRNTVETWSATPVTLGNSVYDFTTGANKAYGDNQVLVDANTYAIYSGDIAKDAGESVDLIDLAILENDINIFAFGYVASDINGDGNVDLLDGPAIEANVNNFIFAVHP